MNGVHDMGGMHGFGPVQREDNEPVFHADWERRAFALTLAMGATGCWNLDMSRFARESLPPALYLASSYYEIWFAALCNLLLQAGLATRQEISEGKMIIPPEPVAHMLKAEHVATVLGRGAPVERPAKAPPRFGPGDRVRARNMHPATHTRLPRYVRGHAGVIEEVHGCHVFPDDNAAGRGENPDWLYGVRFSAAELWGSSENPTDAVHVDCWQSYLEPLPGEAG